MEDPLSLFFAKNILSLQVYIFLVIAFLLLLLACFFSMVKMVFASFSDKEVLEKSNNKELSTAILFVSILTNLALVYFLYKILSIILSEYAHTFLFGETIAIIFITIVILFIFLLFTEILPKVFLEREKTTILTFLYSNQMGYVQKLFYPMVKIAHKIETTIENKLQKKTIPIDQITQALDLASKDEITSQDQKKILEGIVSFGNTEVGEVMVSTKDMFAIENNTTFQTTLKLIKEQGYSRIPVYEENVKKIIGMLYTKDLIPHIYKEEYDWIKLIRKPYFIPKNQKLDDLLTDFQKKKIHLAIVVDEQQNTLGMITLEDVIEEIVGDINDEFDEDHVQYSKLDEYTYSFDGKITLKDFYRILNIKDSHAFDEKKSNSETIAALMLDIFNGVPSTKKTIDFEGYQFTIELVDKKKIKRIKVAKIQHDAENN